MTGVYVRTPFGPDYPADNPTWLVGYNAKIDKNRLGGLIVEDSKNVAVIRSLIPPEIRFGQWLTLEVIAEGNHIVVKIDGKTTADYTDDQRRFTKGHIALQQHAAATVAEFRKIEIKEQTPTKTSKVPPAQLEPSPIKVAPPASKELEALSRDKISPEALALAGDGDPKRAPASLVAVFGEPRPFHTQKASCLAYSGNGRWLASGGHDQTITRQDAEYRVKGKTRSTA